MLHVFFITIYILLSPPEGGKIGIVRDWPQPFISRELCEKKAVQMQESEQERLETMRPGWEVGVTTTCNPPE